MKNKAAILFTTWALVIIAYIILPFIMPVMQDISDDVYATVNASSNMSNYVGAGETVQLYPLFAWFIPGIIGGIVTVVTLRER